MVGSRNTVAAMAVLLARTFARPVFSFIPITFLFLFGGEKYLEKSPQGYFFLRGNF